MKNVYLSLAVVGGVLPYVFFLQFFSEHGIELGGFISALFENGAAGGFTVDLLITSLTFWIFLWTQKTPRLWVYVLVNLTIGLSCALPVYLYIRSRDRAGNSAGVSSR